MRAFRPLVFVLVSVAAGATWMLACVGDSPVGTPTPDASNADTSAPDAGGTPDVFAPGDGSAADVVVEAAPCSNPAVGSVIQLSGGGAFPFIPGSGPLIPGDYILTSVQLDCNGACSVDTGAVFGGVHISSAGPGQITVERRIELQQADAGASKFIDKWSGSFDQINRMLQLDEACPGAATDAGWGGGFPTDFLDGGPTNMFKIRFGDVKILSSQGPTTALMTFTRQ